MMTGADHIYFLHDRTTGTIKIGASSDPESRMKTLQAMMPNDLVPLRYVKVLDGFEVERQLHEKFTAIRVRGEWFKATPELLAFAQTGDVGSAVSNPLPSPGLASVPPKDTFSLTHLAALGNVTARTLRYYISCDLLPPPYRMGRQALYGQEHLQRLMRIKEQQAAGLTLNQILAGFSKVQHHSQPTNGQPLAVTVYTLADDLDMTIRGDVPPSRKRQLLHAIALMEQQINSSETSVTSESDKET